MGIGKYLTKILRKKGKTDTRVVDGSNIVETAKAQTSLYGNREGTRKNYEILKKEKRLVEKSYDKLKEFARGKRTRTLEVEGENYLVKQSRKGQETKIVYFETKKLEELSQELRTKKKGLEAEIERKQEIRRKNKQVKEEVLGSLAEKKIKGEEISGRFHNAYGREIEALITAKRLAKKHGTPEEVVRHHGEGTAKGEEQKLDQIAEGTREEVGRTPYEIETKKGGGQNNSDKIIEGFEDLTGIDTFDGRIILRKEE